MNTLDFASSAEIPSTYIPETKPEVVLHLGDTIDFTSSLPDESVDLVVTSPPYNVGKDYEKRAKIESYLATQEALIERLSPKIKSTGSICWQVGNYVEDGEVFPLDIFYYPIFKRLGFQLRNRVIWHFGHGLHAKARFSGRYETLLWFTKSKNYKFNLDAVRVPSKYPGKLHYKGSKKGKPSGNPLGKNPFGFLAICRKRMGRGRVGNTKLQIQSS